MDPWKPRPNKSALWTQHEEQNNQYQSVTCSTAHLFITHKYNNKRKPCISFRNSSPINLLFNATSGTKQSLSVGFLQYRVSLHHLQGRQPPAWRHRIVRPKNKKVSPTASNLQTQVIKFSSCILLNIVTGKSLLTHHQNKKEVNQSWPPPSSAPSGF